MSTTGETAMTVRADDGEWSVARIIEQATKIQLCMTAVMKNGEHYGIIPGTSRKDPDTGKEIAKPTLLKPGAEKLCLMFRLKPSFAIVDKVDTDTKIAFTIRCLLTHIPTGNEIAEGLGSCNSREAKYLRPAPKKCPLCAKETIFKSKRPGEGYYCWNKKGGCGATFGEGDETIEGQSAGIADPSDLHNTILKMACKRSLVAAVLNGTAASDFFTQDLEDLGHAAAEYTPPAAPGSVQRATDGRQADDAEYSSARMASEMEDEPRISRPPAKGRAKASDDFVEVKDGRTGAVTRQPRVDADQLAEIDTLAKRGGYDKPAVLKLIKDTFKADDVFSLGRGQAIDLIRRLTKKVDAAANALDGVAEYARQPGDDAGPAR